MHPCPWSHPTDTHIWALAGLFAFVHANVYVCVQALAGLVLLWTQSMPQHKCTHRPIHVNAQRHLGLQRDPRSSLTMEVSHNWPFCCWSQQGPGGGRGGKPKGDCPLTLAQPQWRPWATEVRKIFVFLSLESAPRIYTKYCQNFLNKLPFGKLFFRFTQFLNS